MKKSSSYKTKEKSSSANRNRKKEKRDKRIYEKVAFSSDNFEKNQILVRMKGLEPSRREAYAPKAYVSTNSTTSAYSIL